MIFLTFLTVYLFQSIIWLLYFSSNSGVESWTGGSLHRSFRRSEMERLYEKLPEFPG